jgi:hypothetical protein
LVGWVGLFVGWFVGYFGRREIEPLWVDLHVVFVTENSGIDAE